MSTVDVCNLKKTEGEKEWDDTTSTYDSTTRQEVIVQRIRVERQEAFLWQKGQAEDRDVRDAFPPLQY